MVKRKVAWEFYVISAAITFFILFLGIYLGVFLSRGKIEELRSQLSDLKLKQEDLLLELSLLTLEKNISCSLLGNALERVMEDAEKLGNRVTLYETTEKVKDPEFYSLKKEYTLTLIRYWLYVKELKKNCEREDIVTVLYFYSNKNCNDCPIQGTILTFLKRKYPQNLMIFALDYDIELNIVSIIKERYGIKKVPSLIIEEEKYENLITLDELSKILCSKYKLC